MTKRIVGESAVGFVTYYWSEGSAKALPTLSRRAETSHDKTRASGRCVSLVRGGGGVIGRSGDGGACVGTINPNPDAQSGRG